ncbi:MAG: response regulator [Pirellulales bacterium]|nr:response regulator [Pirellulales bacterium]
MSDNIDTSIAGIRSASKRFFFWGSALLSLVAMVTVGFAVLAAYRPIDDFGWGIVAKVNISEIRAPFIRAGIIVLGAVGVLVGCGSLLLVWLAKSIITDSERNANELLEANQLLREIAKERKIAEDQYRLLAERVSDVIWTSDIEFNWTYVSPSIKKLCGFTPEEAMERTLEEALTPDSTELVLLTLREKLEEAETDPATLVEPAVLEVEYNCKDGSTVWGEVNASFVLGDDGMPVGLIGISRNIEARKAAEAKLREAKEAAEAANRAKSEFLANMSHEIRTPMTAILGYAEILRSESWKCSKQRKCRESADTITRNGKHLLDLINSVLDLSKIEAGKLVVERKDCSPARIVDEVMALMKVRTDEKRLGFRVRFDGPIPESIRSGPGQLRQILINLVGNAVKFTEKGLVEIVVRLVHAEDDEPRIEFVVSDTGIGMTEEQAAEVFEPFSQADSSTTRQFGGTGLGLAISKRLAEKLSGDLYVSSEIGRGSDFTLSIATGPLGDVKMLDNPTAVVREPERTDVFSSDNDFRLDCRVLLVEDGPDNQRIISFFLENAGAEVSLATNGQAALDYYKSSGNNDDPFDVVVMDMQMPIMDGYEATRCLRAEGFEGPIIALTAHAMVGDRDKCLAAGCDDYIAKPVDRRKLVSYIARWTKSKLAAPR